MHEPHRFILLTVSEVSQWFFDTYAGDLQRVARGGAASAAMLAEQQSFRLCPLSEGPIEGYHSEVQRLVTHGHRSTPPWVFAKLRLRDNLERLESWCARPSGLSIVSFEWSRHKRILQPPTENGREDMRVVRGRGERSTASC